MLTVCGQSDQREDMNNIFLIQTTKLSRANYSTCEQPNYLDGCWKPVSANGSTSY